MAVGYEPERFFDGDLGPGTKLSVVLEQDFQDPIEQWKLLHAIGYRDRHFDEPFIVPRDKDTFRTDLTSVPSLFAWLVPKTGAHLPAALLHDGLVVGPDEQPTHIGPAVTRIQADRIFRDAMADMDTPLTRRWLVWTAVTLASVITVRPRFLSWIMYLGLAVIPVLGVIATLDLFDLVNVLPWMGNRGWLAELVFGALGAIVIPIVLMLPWGVAHLYKAGLIAGLAIATLLHVTIAVALVSAAYWLLAKLVD